MSQYDDIWSRARDTSAILCRGDEIALQVRSRRCGQAAEYHRLAVESRPGSRALVSLSSSVEAVWLQRLSQTRNFVHPTIYQQPWQLEQEGS